MGQVVRAVHGRCLGEDMLVQALRDQTIALGVLEELGGGRARDAQNATLYYLDTFREAGEIADELVAIACDAEEDTPPGEETEEAERRQPLMARLETMLRDWNDHYIKLGEPGAHSLGDSQLCAFVWG